MSSNISTLDLLRSLGPGGWPIPPQVQSKRSELTQELHKYMHILGPTPKRCLETLADLGRTDLEIASYFKIPKHIVTDLRQVWRINGEP